MKIEKQPGSKFGFSCKSENDTLPNAFDAIGTKFKEIYGPNAIEELAKETGIPSDHRMFFVFPMAIAIGAAFGGGRASGAATAADAQRAREDHLKAAALIAAKTPAPKKDFPAMVRELEASGLTKAQAVTTAVKTCPKEHQEWLRTGDTSKL